MLASIAGAHQAVPRHRPRRAQNEQQPTKAPQLVSNALPDRGRRHIVSTLKGVHGMDHRKAGTFDKATKSGVTNNDLNDCPAKLLSSQSALDALPQSPAPLLGEVRAMLCTINHSAKSDSSTDHDLRLVNVQTSSRKDCFDILDESRDGLRILR